MVATYENQEYRKDCDLRCNKLVKTWWTAHVALGKPHSHIYKTHDWAWSFARIRDNRPADMEEVAVAKDNSPTVVRRPA